MCCVGCSRRAPTTCCGCSSPRPDVTERGLGRLLDTARETRAALVYSDYLQQEADGAFRLCPLVQHQPGSIRDDFDFGQMVLLDASRLAGLIDEVQRSNAGTRFGGWYDLRLRLSEAGPVVHARGRRTRSPRSSKRRAKRSTSSTSIPATGTTRSRWSKWPPSTSGASGRFWNRRLLPCATVAESFPVEASVVIPVRNRERTVADAVKSCAGTGYRLRI